MSGVRHYNLKLGKVGRIGEISTWPAEPSLGRGLLLSGEIAPSHFWFAVPSPHRDAGFLHHKQQFSCRDSKSRIWWGLCWNLSHRRKSWSLGTRNPPGVVGGSSGQPKLQDQLLNLAEHTGFSILSLLRKTPQERSKFLGTGLLHQEEEKSVYGDKVCRSP